MTALLISLYCVGVVTFCIPTGRAIAWGLERRRRWTQDYRQTFDLVWQAAQLALEEYDRELRSGGEPHYPQWAADLINLKIDHPERWTQSTDN